MLIFICYNISIMKDKESIKQYNIEELYFILTNYADRLSPSVLDNMLTVYDKKIRLRYLKNKFPEANTQKYYNLV